MKNTVKEIQEQLISTYDGSKLCSFDVEIIKAPTMPLIHQTARFWLFKKGEGKILINNKTYNIHDNALVTIMPWDTTKIESVEKPLHLNKIIFNTNYIKIYGLGNSFIDYSFFNSNVSPVLQLNNEQTKEIGHIIKNIKDEIGVDSLYKNNENKLLSEAYVSLKINELYILFLRYKNVTNTKLVSNDENNKKEDILKYIYSHISDISLSQLADVFFMSESAISKYISTQTNKSFSEIVKQIKITKVIELLIHTDLSLSEISDIVGFSDTQYLISVFVKEKGVSPKKYRQLYQSDVSVLQTKKKNLGYQVIEFVNKHYAEDVNEMNISKRFNTNMANINSALLALTELNFEGFLNYIRINKACVMLLETKLSIIDIGEAVGYNNTKTFTRNFSKFKKMMPLEFRKKVHLQKGSESIPEHE